ncbi:MULTISPECIES: carbohydrate ABC transporter permease [Saccharothrix]|uniref:ABC transporter permease n=2 Tax=Saccharothrix TaxID=2071 RepID=A0ABU0X306_9PSEU|nr:MULTISPECIES: sugar ABC transporter permease [Saccharothrix]MDQ2586526.1 ABC transporter permease [Saccharothrix yanglingensis]MDR6593301.1 cellobiose transport system permease protein [Saccharothrix longispora]MDU0292134.1 sugar ABC transporter permease [Saccharothrix longispora]
MTGLNWRERRHRWDTRYAPYAYIAPYFLLFSVFGLFPLLYTAWVSMQDRNLLDGDAATFIGLDNYVQLLTADPYFWNAMGNTLSLWLLTTVPQILFALGIAQLLNRRLRGRTFFRMGVLLPNITSVAAVTIIFAQLFGRDFGLVNWGLELFGAGRVDWQAGTGSSHTAIAAMVVWRWTGYHALIFLASMQAIPSTVYEAARLDGANAWQQFWRITVPMLRPQIIFSTVIATAGNMRLLAEPLLFNPGAAAATGGSDRQFQTAALYLYEQGFAKFDFGYASAIAWLLLIATIAITGLSYLAARRIRTD